MAGARGSREMKARTASRAAWLLWSLTAGLSGASLVLTFLNRSVLGGADLVADIGMPVAAVGSGTVGALITARRRNRIGWIFCTIGLGFAVYSFSWGYVIRGLASAPGSLPGTAYLAWAKNRVLNFGIAPIPLLFLLFPD